MRRMARLFIERFLARRVERNFMKPYEKFKTFGAESLTDEELLAVFIRTGTKDSDSVDLAEKIIHIFPEKNLLGLFHVSWRNLMEIPGIGEVKAIKLACLAELARRISRTRANRNLKFTDAKTVAEYYKEDLRNQENEQVLLIMLDSKLRRMSDAVISIGTVCGSVLSPREVFMTALKGNAAYIMLLHNHPSGDAAPSSADLQMTEEICFLGDMMEIPLLDHIIIGDDQYFSLNEAGFIKHRE